jgi:hypothetical protein
MKGRIFFALLVLIAILFIPAPARAQTTFFYVATAVDSNGVESVFSNEASATINQQAVPPKLSVVLKWNASTSTVLGYNMYRSKVSGSGYVKINTALITGLTYTDTFLPPAPPTGLSGT